MKKIIPCIIVIVAVLGGLLFYSHSKKPIINASEVTKIDVPAPSIKDPKKKYKSFTTTQSIVEFIRILNSSKQWDKAYKYAKHYINYPIAIYNKDGSIITLQLNISSENAGEWIISGSDGTSISKDYILPSKQAKELYNILKDIPN